MTADSGDQAGQIELRRELAANHRDAYAWALNCCRRNRTDAEDVLQATYLKVLEGRARFDGRSAFKTWLFGVVRLTAADQRRRHFLRDLVMGRAAADEELLYEPASGADASLGQAQQRVALERALKSLPGRQREVLLLVFYHELTVEDAARVMAIGTGSARQHYARGKAKLRELLAQREGVR
jgi:RNA polymerase sigma-70 factor, ECF subfamily